MMHHRALNVALLPVIALCLKTRENEKHVFAIHDRDLVFVHVPMNYGNPITEYALTGGNSTMSYDEVTGAGRAGWDKIVELAQPNATIWGPMNPDLQQKTDYGCPQYYTPQKFWPKDLAERYFGNKTVFGMLRDPYDRLMAAYRGMHHAQENLKDHGKVDSGVRRGWNFEYDKRSCDFSGWVKTMLHVEMIWTDQLKCQMQPQAPFFEGPYAIEIPVDNRKFPFNANKLLKEHGYDNIYMEPENMMHVTGCDNAWAGDLDDEAKRMIKKFYAKDFDLLCEKFGYCDQDEKVCCVHVPGMCPHKQFKWHPESQTYEPKRNTEARELSRACREGSWPACQALNRTGPGA